MIAEIISEASANNARMIEGLLEKAKGLFSSPVEPEPTALDVAWAIIDERTTLGVDFSDSDVDDTLARKKAKEILKSLPKDKNGNPDSQAAFLVAIELVGKPATTEDYHLLSVAYSACHVEYTLYAIKATEEYIKRLEPPEVIEITEIDLLNYPWLTPEIRRGEIMSEPWIGLGMLYEKAQDYKMALKCYKKALEYDKWSHLPYIYMSEAYAKLNQLDKSVGILTKAKLHPNYKHKNGDDSHLFKKVVDNYLADAIEKRNAKKVFKPRKHKDFLEPPDHF